MLEGRHLVQLGESVATPRFQVEDSALSVKSVLREGRLQDKAGPSVATEIGALLPTINGEDSVWAWREPSSSRSAGPT